jgi:hypothetical protein
MMTLFRTLALAALLIASVASCADPASGRADVPLRNTSDFENQVWPVLRRDCGFHACHGSPDRFFRVYGIGRARLFPEDDPFDVMNSHIALERDYTLQFALSMIDHDDPSRSLLLRKPLAVAAGGSGHLGVDKFGRNVYRTTESEGYTVLARWVLDVVDQAPPSSGAPIAGSAAPIAGSPAIPGFPVPAAGAGVPITP